MRLKRVIWLTLLMITAVAQPARASIWDIIWEMSGPQMIGFGARCDFFRSDAGCYTAIGLQQDPQATPDAQTASEQQRKVFLQKWLQVEPYLYVATGKGAWEAGSAMMVAFDPMFAFSWCRDDRDLRIYSAAGVSLDYFVGARVEQFGAIALKFRPVTVDFFVKKKGLHAVSVSWTFRRYRGITVVEDGPRAPFMKGGGKGEWTTGPNVVLLFR